MKKLTTKTALLISITWLELIKEHNPSAPVFLLGESMGGAIALNTAAQFGQNLRGVIASVPSAERLQAKRMSLTVALHFLNGPDKPFQHWHPNSGASHSQTRDARHCGQAASRPKMSSPPKS
jgi:alpha-beta hydrolase superfamily lysophospholipase